MQRRTREIERRIDPVPELYVYRRLVQAKIYMETHYAENIDLTCVADEAYFSRFHFLRRFRDIYGFTPHQYLRKVRMERAMVLLNSGISVSDTCFRIGLEGLSSFTKAFKGYTGMTPSEYCRQQRSKARQHQESPLRFIPGCFAHQHGWI